MLVLRFLAALWHLAAVLAVVEQGKVEQYVVFFPEKSQRPIFQFSVCHVRLLIPT